MGAFCLLVEFYWEGSVSGACAAGYIYFSKHWPFGPMLSISRNVCVSVRLSVCLCVCVTC